jgi:hypothetical protein
MVIEHRLEDDYENALDWLKESQADWRDKPLLYRLYCHFMSRWWLRPSMWRFMLRQRKLIPELEALLNDKNK